MVSVAERVWYPGCWKCWVFPSISRTWNEKADGIRFIDPRGLSALLGAEVYAGGTLNKPLLASYLFGSPEHAKEINCIVHPRVKEDFRRWTQCRTAFPIVGIESAILVEAGFAGEVDAIVMVYAPEEVRILRAVRRDASSRELIEKRIRSQMNDEEKRKYADFVIVNDGETPLIPQVLELIGSLSEKMHYLLRK